MREVITLTSIGRVSGWTRCCPGWTACARPAPRTRKYAFPVVSYTLTIRRGPRVQRERYDDLEAALGAVERHGGELERTAHTSARGGTFIRTIEPVQQVIARLELSGPERLRAGVDVRGDGSSEAFTGRVRRRLVEQRGRESAYDALRRALDRR